MFAELAYTARKPAVAGQEMTMESVNAIKPDAAKGAERERSTIEFPYTDLDNAVEVVKGVHHAGGTACDYDQLAAQLKAEAKGGGFRLRVGGAKLFGLVGYERGGRINLTDLGRQIIDPLQERQARMHAFLTVPLYLRVYEQFKGGPLPPQAGLERAIESMGVGAKVKDRARQVMLRAAKQAGFFEHAQDRLVRPSIRDDGRGEIRKEAQEDASVQRNSQGNGGGSGDGGGGGKGREHPLIQGLLMTLPEPGTAWGGQERANWLTMANSIFTMIYSGDPASIDIKANNGKGGQQPDR